MQLIEVRGGVHVQQVPVPVPVPAVVERVVSMCCAVGRAELWKNVVPSMTTCTCTCTCCNVSKCAQLMTSRSPACTGHGAIQLYAEYGIGLRVAHIAPWGGDTFDHICSARGGVQPP